MPDWPSIGAMTKVYASTLGVAAASFDVSSISGSYNHLLLVAQLRADASSATVSSGLRLNNDSGSNYDRALVYAAGATPTWIGQAAQTSIWVGDWTANSAAANTACVFQILIPFYAKTTFYKTVLFSLGGVFGTLETTTSYEVTQGAGLWRNSGAVTRVTLFPPSGNLMAGSSLTIHGIT
jgi:hypothetical protein